MLTKGHSKTRNRILVVDDEAPVRSLLDRILKQAGFQVSCSVNGREGLEKVHNENPDLIILDLNLPDLSGEEICKKIRQTPEVQAVSVMILTGRNTHGLSSQCLNGGADDYIAKPFDIEELVARVRALLRRPHIYTSEEADIKRPQISIQSAEHLVLWNGKRVEDLAPKEFELLRQLILLSPRVVNKNALALKVWGTPLEHIHQRTLDVHVRRIRKKIGLAGSRCLKTVPCIGYQWDDRP